MTSWKDTTLGDEIELAYGKSLAAHAREPGPFKVFGSNGCVGHHSSALIDGPGIIVGRKGSLGEVAYCAEPFWPIDTTYYVVNKGGHNWRFLYHLLSDLGLTQLNSHSAVPGLNREDVYSIPVALPGPIEQARIAIALDAVQHSISLEYDAEAAAREVKRTAMSTLFSRGLYREAQKETEIGPVPISWTVGPIRDFAQFQRGFDITKDKQARGNVPVVSSGGIKSYHSHAAAIGPGVIIGRKGSIGLLHFVESDYWPHDTTLWCKDFMGNLPKFVFYRLHTVDMKRLDSGAANPALNRNYLHDETISWPGVEEQTHIVEVLDAIDRKIDLHRRKRAVFDDLFKVLLHKLMTGEIRVADLDLSALDAQLTSESAA